MLEVTILLMVALLICLAWSAYMLKRNEWVYRERRKLIEESFQEAKYHAQLADTLTKEGKVDLAEKHTKLAEWWMKYIDQWASYDQMLNKSPWCWDISCYHYHAKPYPGNVQ